MGCFRTHPAVIRPNRVSLPKVSLTWTPNDDILIYGLYSEGFRFGGPNVNFGVPPTFKSDSLRNYEIGARTNWWDRRLQLDATAFYIDWSDIQLSVVSPAFQSYAANAGKAVNYGFEGSATLRPISGLALQANLTYLDATLRQDFNPGAGGPIIRAGSVLPGASKWHLSDSATYTWSDVSYRPSVTLLHRYVSKALGEFGNITPVTTGDYNEFDLRARVELKGVGITAFVDNIGDVRGVSAISDFSAAVYQRYIIRPRIIGLTFDYKM